jgi:hypothetical protein
MQFVEPTPFEEAIAKFGERSPVTSVLKSADWRAVPVELRERAFFSATVENVRFLQLAQTTIMDSITGATAVNDRGEKYFRAGGRAQFIERMQQFAIKSGMGPLDPNDKRTLKDIRSEGRLALIYDTTVKAAQDYGYWKQGQDPDVLDAFPAQRFIRVHLVKKPRPYHRAHEGEVHRKDDLDFWLDMNRDFHVPWGPWGFNSGMDVEDVGRRVAEQLGLVRRDEDFTTATARAKTPEKSFNSRLQASTQGLNPKLVNFLKLAFGNQAKIADGAVTWEPKTNPSYNRRTRGGQLTDSLREGRPESGRITSAPEPPPLLPSKEEALRRLRKGEPVTDPDGDRQHFGQKAIDHFDEKSRRGNRFPVLNWAEEAVRAPSEKWRDGDQVNYVKWYAEKNRTKAVLVSTTKGEVTTFWDTSKLSYVDRFRKGEELVKQKERATGR